MAWLNRFLSRGNRRTGHSRPPKESKDELVAGDSAFLKVASGSYRSLLRTVASDAERIAASIKDKARSEAEAAAAQIVAHARLEVQEIQGKAEIAAREEAQNIVSAAEKEAANIELEAREKAFQFLVETSQAIEKEISQEYGLAVSRLSSYLQGLSIESEKIDTELKSKLARLVANKSWALKEAATSLPGTPKSDVPSLETSMPVQIAAEPGSEIEAKIAGTNLPPEIAGAREAREYSLENAEVKPTIAVESPQPALETLAPQTESVLEEVPVEEKAVAEAGVSPAPAAEPILVAAGSIISEAEPAAKGKHRGRRTREQTEITAQEALTLPEADKQTLYTGEVELVIIPPVDLEVVSRLYNYLQTVSELKVLYTRGSWNQGTTIVVTLEEPFTLIKAITGIPGMVVSARLLAENSAAAGKLASLLRRRDNRSTKKIALILKEARGAEENGEV